MKHGNSSSVRLINQSFGLPKDIDVSKLSTEVSLCCVREANQPFHPDAQLRVRHNMRIHANILQVTKSGRLVISAPQLKDTTSGTTLAEMGLSQQGDVDMTSASESKKTISEAAFDVEGGGKGTSKKVEDTKKKSQASTTKRVTEDGWEEEVTEEFEEEV